MCVIALFDRKSPLRWAFFVFGLEMLITRQQMRLGFHEKPFIVLSLQ